MDLSFKSLAMVGILVGSVAWIFDGSTPEKAERSPSASFKDSRRFKKEAYKPKLDEFSGQRDEEFRSSEGADIVQENDEAVSDGALAEQEARPAVERGFEQYRVEITQHLAQGDVDTAVNYAEQKLGETLQSSSSEMSSIGYLHEFLLQHMESPEDKISVTVNALRGAQDANVRRFLYERFQNNSPTMMEDLDTELDEAGIFIE